MPKFYVCAMSRHDETDAELDRKPKMEVEAESHKDALVSPQNIGPGIYAVNGVGEKDRQRFEVSFEKKVTPFRTLKVTGHDEAMKTVDGYLAWLCNPTLAEDQS